jgi:phage tail-like protein
MSSPHHRHAPTGEAAAGEGDLHPVAGGATARHRRHGATLQHSPHPIVLGLPGIYQEGHLVAGICAAADATLAPVFAVLDSFPAHLDPATTPEDMIAWLASWIGAVLPTATDPGPRREALQRTAEHLAWYGTAHGIRTALATIHGIDVDIDEPGATAWTLDPDTPLPGESATRPVHFRVTAAGLDLRSVDALLAQLKPAHVRHTTELLDRATIDHL